MIRQLLVVTHEAAVLSMLELRLFSPLVVNYAYVRLGGACLRVQAGTVVQL